MRKVYCGNHPELKDVEMKLVNQFSMQNPKIERYVCPRCGSTTIIKE